MEGRFDWHQPAHQEPRNSLLPPPDRLGWWMVVSLTAAIVLHIGLFISLGHLPVGLGWNHSAEEMTTEPVVVRAVEEDEPRPIDPATQELPAPDPDRITLLDDVEVLQQLKEPELEMKPTVEVASFHVDASAASPALAGNPAGDEIDVANAVNLAEEDLASLGETASISPTVADGQMIVDPGSDAPVEDNLDSVMRDLIKKGSEGTSLRGKIDGVVSLDEMMGLPENVLVTKTTMLPGDLLFEYNKADLRDSSKVGMQKIALLMDLNPPLHCWIEGHSDLIGSDEFNHELSLRRAQAVKDFLVGIGMDAQKIHTRGLGKRQPIVLSGNQEQQALNRRVEIKMRKRPPTEKDFAVPAGPTSVSPTAPKAQPVKEEPNAPPAAVRVKPMRALPLEEEAAPAPIKAIPADDSAPKAQEVAE